MLFMLDTSIVSAAMRGVPEVDSRLQALDPGQVCLSSITRAEIRFGVARRPEAKRLAELADAFLQFVRCEPFNSAAADRYGTMKAQLRQQGRPIGDLDELLAAHALALGAVMVTDNEKHFRQVPGLRVENWLAGH